MMPDDKPVIESGNIALLEAEVDIGKAIKRVDHIKADDAETVIVDEAFMHEKVVILISPPANESEPEQAQVSVNVRHYYIPRGRPVVVPRFVVEALAHAKQENFKMNAGNSNDPTSTRPVSNHLFSYPFMVSRDDNPKGRAWLEKVMHDPS